MTWERGRERIQQLIDDGELGQVPADTDVAKRMLLDAERHLATAATAESTGDLSGAYQLAYDALRKSAAGLLAAQGLRPTSRGGHVAVQEAVTAQFGATIRVLRSFARIRRARNSFEYPSSETPGPSADDVEEAVKIAAEVHKAATTILNEEILTPWQ
jgi:HEPN domain-containing protein